jgi:hypothetical protein
MSPVVMMPQVKPPVVVTAPFTVPPAAAIFVNPTTRMVGVAETGRPSTLAVTVRGEPIPLPIKVAV